MRIYRSCDEMHEEVKRDLHEMGTIVHPQTMQDKAVGDDADYRTLELSPYGFMLEDATDRDDWLRRLGCSLPWAIAEFNERARRPYMTGSVVNPGEAWTHREHVWKEFIHQGRFAYTYSERIGLGVADMSTQPPSDTSAIRRVIFELSTNPDSRQCVLPIFNAIYDLPNLGGIARVPCSLHYQFLRRREALEMLYVMRSSDFATHFPYDIWLACELQRFVATELGVPAGRFTFFTGSLHLYAKDADPGVF